MKVSKYKHLKHGLLSLFFVVLGTLVPILPSADAHAQSVPLGTAAAAITQANINAGDLPETNADNTAISRVLDIVFAVSGSLSLLMIIVGGLRYITAGGDAGAVSRAKGTIIYAVVGLLVTLAAYSIVTLVVNGVA